MIAIIGAGITGLSLHHYLRQREIESVVFEASSEPGGVIRTIHGGGRVLECGPQRMRMTSTVRELIDEVGLENQLIEAADVPLYVYYGGTLRLAPLSVRKAIATDLLSLRGKLRVLLEPLSDPPVEGETVEEYLRRSFGAEFATRLGGPLYAGLYASDPGEMPVEHSLARAIDRFGIEGSLLVSLLRHWMRRRSPPPVVSFQDGMQSLPEALYERYGDNIQLDVPVQSIERSQRGYDLVGDGVRLRADTVVLTTPAPVAASLLEAVDPMSAEALRVLSYNPLAVVHLLAEDSLDGAGYQVPLTEESVTLGVTYNDGLFGHQGLKMVPPSERSGTFETGREGIYTCFLGGAKTPEAVEWSDETLANVSEQEFRVATGVAAEAIHVRRNVPGMPAYDHSWDHLVHLDPPPEVHVCANYESRAGIPGRVVQGQRLATTLAREDTEPDQRIATNYHGSNGI